MAAAALLSRARVFGDSVNWQEATRIVALTAEVVVVRLAAQSGRDASHLAFF
jgi:hypothetical protein